MIIPPESLSEETLRGVIEQFVNREGTDYGYREKSFQEKVDAIRRQIAGGKVSIVFDSETQSVNILPVDIIEENQESDHG